MITQDSWIYKFIYLIQDLSKYSIFFIKIREIKRET